MTTNNEKWKGEFHKLLNSPTKATRLGQVLYQHQSRLQSNYISVPDLEDFISKVRQEAIEERDREIREWIDTVKKDVPSKMDDSLYPVVVDSYNQALSDLLEVLSDNKK